MREFPTPFGLKELTDQARVTGSLDAVVEALTPLDSFVLTMLISAAANILGQRANHAGKKP